MPFGPEKKAVGKFENSTRCSLVFPTGTEYEPSAEVVTLVETCVPSALKTLTVTPETPGSIGLVADWGVGA